jgi:hypothetical protein
MHLPYIRKVFAQKEILLLPLMVGQIPIEKLNNYARALLPFF